MGEKVLRSAVMVLLAILPATAIAQTDRGKNQIDVFVGELFGDDLTEEPITGSEPELDDDVTFGVRYTYNFTPAWGLEFSLGLNTNTATQVFGAPRGEIDMDVLTFDADAIWNYNAEANTIGYIVFGIGFASADLDNPFSGTLPSSASVTIDDDDGFTLNAGAGVKFFTTDNFLIRLEARYRFVDALVDEVDDTLNTVETTVGVAWTF